MSSTLNRLRRLSSLREPRVPPDADPVPYQTSVPSRRGGALHELVPGEPLENAGGVCYVSTRADPLEEPRGPAALGSLLAAPPATFHRYYPAFRLDAAGDYRRADSIDTE